MLRQTLKRCRASCGIGIALSCECVPLFSNIREFWTIPKEKGDIPISKSNVKKPSRQEHLENVRSWLADTTLGEAPALEALEADAPVQIKVIQSKERSVVV